MNIKRKLLVAIVALEFLAFSFLVLLDFAYASLSYSKRYADAFLPTQSFVLLLLCGALAGTLLGLIIAIRRRPESLTAAAIGIAVAIGAMVMSGPGIVFDFLFQLIVPLTMPSRAI